MVGHCSGRDDHTIGLGYNVESLDVAHERRGSSVRDTVAEYGVSARAANVHHQQESWSLASGGDDDVVQGGGTSGEIVWPSGTAVIAVA